MDQAVIERDQAAGIDVTLPYIDKSAGIGYVYTYAYEQNTMKFEDHPTRITDARGMTDRFTLATAGFQLVTAPCSPCNYYNKDSVEGIYWPEMERYMLDFLGCEK